MISLVQRIKPLNGPIPPAICAVTRTTKANSSNFTSNKRQSKIMNKLLYGKITSKRKRFFDGDAPKMTTAVNLSNPHNQGRNAPRRVAVLNKLFMQNISDLLATGSGGISERISGMGLEISNVKVSNDFHCVNVYWVAKGLDKDHEIEETLNSIAGSVRHELSQLRLMGQVPRIQFVKDNRLSKLAEVDTLLAKIDFGDDYEPSQRQWPSDLIEPDVVNGDIDVRLPSMQHNVFGLDRSVIMNKIQKNLSKSKQAWEKYEAYVRPEEGHLEVEVKQISKASNVQNDEEFSQFLKQRQYSKSDGEHRSGRERQRFDAHDFYANEQSSQMNDDFDEEPGDSPDEQDYFHDDYDRKR